MGVSSFLMDLFIEESKPEDVVESFNTFKFVAIAGSISLVLFGVGYMFYGLGSTLVPVSIILDELHEESGKPRK